MIMDRVAVQAPDLMGRVMVEEVPVQDFTVIKADMAIRSTRVVIIIRGISSNSRSRVTRATRSS